MSSVRGWSISEDGNEKAECKTFGTDPCSGNSDSFDLVERKASRVGDDHTVHKGGAS